MIMGAGFYGPDTLVAKPGPHYPIGTVPRAYENPGPRKWQKMFLNVENIQKVFCCDDTVLYWPLFSVDRLVKCMSRRTD